MSHNATAPSPPQLSLAYQDATWTAAAGQVLHIVGSNLSTSTKVDVSAFATITGKTYTALTGISGTLTVTMTITSLPGGVINIPISNGGHKAQGTLVTAGSIEANPTWSPEALCSDPADTYWQSTDMPVVADGTVVTSIAPGVGNRGTLATMGGYSTSPTVDYRASRISGEPCLWTDPATVFAYTDILWNSNYEFALANPFTLAAVFRGADASQVLTNSKFYFSIGSNANNGLLAKWQYGRMDQVAIGGAHWTEDAATTPYPTDAQRVIITSDGTSTRIKEGALGIDQTELIGSSTTDMAVGTIRGYSNAELYAFIFMERELSAAEVTLLDAYWQNRYS